jgi:hypothetical protein
MNFLGNKEEKMSLVIPDRFSGKEVIVKSHGFGSDAISIGNSHFTMERFLYIVYYVLTNTDLEENDSRLAFLENIKKAEIIDGWNKEINPKSNSKKIELPIKIF